MNRTQGRAVLTPSLPGSILRPSCLQMGALANLVPASRAAKTPSRPLILSSLRMVVALPLVMSPSHCPIAMAGCCISSQHPLVVSPSCCLVAPAACCIASCHPLIVTPSQLLIVPAGSCVTPCCVTLLSSHCTTILASHCAGWLLSRLSLHCPLIVLFLWLVLASPLPPLLLLLLLLFPPLVAMAVDVHPVPMPMHHLSHVNVP